jgi:hypothetical protein
MRNEPVSAAAADSSVRGVDGVRAGELSEEQRILIDEVWLLLREKGRWPTFAELDRRLYNHCDLQVEGLLHGLPPGLLDGVDMGALPAFVENTQVALTVAGVEATARGRRELTLICAVLRYAVDVEREFEPPPGCLDSKPVLTSNEVASRFDLVEKADLLDRVGAMLAAEPWGRKVTPVNGSAWALEINRSVRRFRDVTEIAGYAAAKRASDGAPRVSTVDGLALPARRSTTAAVAICVLAGIAVPAILLINEGLDQAEKWISIVGVLVAVALAISGAVASWQTRRGGKINGGMAQPTETPASIQRDH